MADQEIVDLIVKIQGQREAEDLRVKMAQVEEQIITLGKSVQANDPKMIALGQSLKTMTDRVQELEKQSKNLSQAMMQTGRVTQDFVAGFTSNGFSGALNAVSNNIEGLVQSLGGTAGLAGALTVAGVAVMVATPYIKSFIASLSTGDVADFRTEIERLGDRIKEISAQPIKLAVDTYEIEEAEKRLTQLKADKLAYDALMSKRTRAETRSGQEFNEVLVESPGARAAVDQARANQARQSEEDDPTLREMRERKKALVAEKEALEKEQIDRPNSVAIGLKISGKSEEIAQLDQDYKKEIAHAHSSGQAVIDNLINEAGKGNALAQNRLIGKLKTAGASDETLSTLQGATPEGIKARDASDDESEKWATEWEKTVQAWADSAAKRRKLEKDRKAGIEARDEAMRRDAARIAQLTTKQQAADAKDDAREAIADKGVIPGGHVIHRAAPGSPVVLLGPNGQPLVTPPEIGSTIPDPATDPLNPKNFPKPGSQFVGSDAKRRARRAKARMSGNAARVSMAHNARQRAREIAARNSAIKKARRPAPKPARANLLMNVNPFDLVATAQARQQAEAARIADERRKNAALGGLPDFKGLDAKARAKILADNAAQRAADPKNRFGLGGTLPPLPSDPRGDILRRGLRGLVGPLGSGEGDAMSSNTKAAVSLAREVQDLKETVGELIRGYQSGQFKSRVVLN